MRGSSNGDKWVDVGWSIFLGQTKFGQVAATHPQAQLGMPHAGHSTMEADMPVARAGGVGGGGWVGWGVGGCGTNGPGRRRLNIMIIAITNERGG